MLSETSPEESVRRERALNVRGLRVLAAGDPLLRRMLAVADAFSAAAVSASFAATGLSPDLVVLSLLFIPAWIVLAKVHGLYDRDHRALRHVTADEVSPLFLWSLSGAAALLIFLHAASVSQVPVTTAVQAWVVAGISALVLRSAMRSLWRALTPPERTIIVGSGPLAAACRRKLNLFDDIHVHVLAEAGEFTAQDLDSFAGQLTHADRVILASPAIDESMLAKLVSLCRQRRIKLSVIPPMRGMFGTAVQLNHVADLPIVEYSTWDVSRSTLLLKRALDVTVALVGLAVLAPLMAGIAVVIRATSPGPALFRQARAGLGGTPFTMLKFRTMIDGAQNHVNEVLSLDALPDPVFKLHEDPRVTTVGRLLRRTSLDELPQLVNVLGGEMSLVGPRPEQIDLVERYTPEQRFRLNAKPGMTGPMQVYGRGDLSFEERLAVEREYIENLTLGRDVRILAHTIAAVGRGNGAY